MQALGEWEWFFDINEDKTKTASIRYPIQDTVELVFENDELFEFEDLINDEGGDFIYFSRNLPKEEEGAKKKAPAKGQEELKPYKTRGWIDFTPLQRPGKRITNQRILLKTLPNEGEDEPVDDPITAWCTYLYIKI